MDKITSIIAGNQIKAGKVNFKNPPGFKTNQKAIDLLKDIESTLSDHIKECQDLHKVVQAANRSKSIDLQVLSQFHDSYDWNSGISSLLDNAVDELSAIRYNKSR